MALMRAYGRYTDELGNKHWVVVQTDAGGDNSYVYVTAMSQTFKLNLNESPFWANYGIPAKDSVLQQLQPDYFVNNIQAFYSQFFPSLIVAKLPQPLGDPTPRYNVFAMRNDGSVFQAPIGT